MEIQVKEILKIDTAQLWVNQGVLFFKFDYTNQFGKLDIGTVKKFETAVISLTQGVPMPFLIDTRNTRGSFTSRAAKLFAHSSYFKKVRICEAFVVNSINTELLINSYKRIYEPVTPFLIFDDIENAIDYCVEAKKRYDADN
ncbi:hypothetical protein ACFO5O_12780 [Geojedonia litorea]|uniref:DUF7793 domain-containing protein n=1 Tax=Geojedonia litorea TaxID=1268269 RepID=A0ABV9N859_9FLAO